MIRPSLIVKTTGDILLLIIRLSILFILSLPVTLWWLVKPVRLLIPSANNVICQADVCVDDEAALPMAEELYLASVKQMTAHGIHHNTSAKFVYCRSKACYASFGGGNERAMSYPYLGTIIAPESWQLYISTHEMVHWAQFKHLGAINTLTMPDWLIEGMAYQFSGAPESDIPEHYQSMLERYRQWASGADLATALESAGHYTE